MAEHRPDGFNASVAAIWEVTARKVGNVHRYADFADTTYLDFVLSAVASATSIGLAAWVAEGMSTFGDALYMGVQSRHDVTAKNTNLGILLLILPLAYQPREEDLRKSVATRLSSLTIDDAKDAFQAIREANPGGLGDAPEQDVRNEPTVTLLEAMKLAADRDMVARQYANGFADVFDFGVPAFLTGFERFGCVEAAIIDSQLRWLAEYPDSLIARKNGPAVAADVQRRAAEVFKLGGIATPEGRAAGVALDRHLRSDGNKLNPGTTADLITACLFVALRENRVVPSAPFRWQVSDWL
jgi:triphosphoribosyl-dephospho-CoA synthase